MRFLERLKARPQRIPSVPFDEDLQGARVALRLGSPADWQAWRSIREYSRDFLTPWEPTWPQNSMTYSYFCQMVRRQTREWQQGKSYNFMIFLTGTTQTRNPLIGGITLNGIERGIAQKGTLGYWLGQPYAGQGYMREAVERVCAFAFDRLDLRRVEASCLPHNEPSKNLLLRTGFEQEGYAKAYMQINGQWQDHLLWGKRRNP